MKRNIIALILVLCTLSLPACFPGSIAQLKADYPETYTFTVDRGYQEEYRFALDVFDRCGYSGPLMDNNTIQYNTKQNLYTDKRFGEITFIANNMGSKYYLLHVTITDIGGDKSEVLVYGYKKFREWGKRIESGKCDIG